MVRLIILLSFFTFGILPAQNSDPFPKAKLEWRNGDSLDGKILPSSGERVNWQSDAFEGPFDLNPIQLQSIDFPKAYLGNNESRPGRFRITFNNGDRLFGELLAIGPETVTFKCPRLSENLVVNRRYLERIERLDTQNLKFSGPGELETWQELGQNESEPADWFTRKTGELATNRWGGELFREIDLPKNVEIAFSLSCPHGQPDIEIGVSEDPKAGPRIETWDDTLVLTHENRFTPILRLSKTSNVLELRVFWNQEKETIQVCTANGNPMAELNQITFKTKPKTPAKLGKPQRKLSKDRDPNRIGFRLLNRSTEISFSRLLVREWDGEKISRYDASKPRMEMETGNILFDLGDLELSPGQGLRVKGLELPLSKIEQLVFSTAQKESPTTPMTRLAWYDGGIISGTLSKLGPDSVKVYPLWLEREFTAELRGAKKLTFPETSEPVVTGADEMKSGSLKLGGALTPGIPGPSNALLAWKPVGSENSRPMVDTRKVEITREAYPGATDEVGDARIYLTNDEVVAGKLISIKDDQIEFSSYLTGTVKIPYSKVRAVDIEGAGVIPNGFVDKGWEIIQSTDQDEPNNPLELAEDEEEQEKKPDVTIDKDVAVIRKGGFGHTNVLVGDRIRFHTKWETNYGMFTLRLFCSDFSKDSPSTDLLIGAQGNKILTATLKPGGIFKFDPRQISFKDQEADIEILARHDRFEVRVNGKLSLEGEVEPDRISGNGIVFQSGGGWQGWSSTPCNIEITKFSVDRTPGFLPKRIINPEAKLNALAVPRFQRDDPPTHVLVASNGDLLRGKLKSVTGDRIFFQSRENELELPKSRIAAIIWLLPPPVKTDDKTDGPQTSSSETKDAFMVTHQLILHDGSRLNLAAESVEARDEIFLGQSEVLGRCRVPIQKMRQVMQAPAHPLTRSSSSDQLAYSDWSIRNTPDPAIPKGDGSEASPMIGKEAPNFTLPLLNGGDFKLSNRKGRVVVLDFWATWCGPCIRAMPEVFNAVRAFDGKIDFCAVNQAETSPIISEFLETRDWAQTVVGLDFQLNVARDYEVKEIPHTVVIGKDGKIAWIHTGNSADLGKKLIQAIAVALQKN